MASVSFAVRSLRSGFRFGAFVEPACRIVGFIFCLPAGENSIQVFGVFKRLRDDDGCVRVVDEIFAEKQFVLDGVTNQTSEKNNVGARTQGKPDIGNRRSAAETRRSEEHT